MFVVECDDWMYVDVWCIYVDQQEVDVFLFVYVGCGVYEVEDYVCVVVECGLCFLVVYDVVIVVVYCVCFY